MKEIELILLRNNFLVTACRGCSAGHWQNHQKSPQYFRKKKNCAK